MISSASIGLLRRGSPARICAFPILSAGLLLLLGGTRALAQVPEIHIEQSGTAVTDGGSVNFGIVSVGSSTSRTFTIRNQGQALLSGLSISKSGVNSADYSTSGPGASSLLPGGSTTFSVTFGPSQSGGRTAIIRVANNDLNENPYDINVSGTGAAPEISVTQAGRNLTDGSSTVSFGNVKTGLTATRRFTVRNAGTGTLGNLSVSLSGSGTFQAESLPVSSLGPNESASFDVTFSPSSLATFTATLRILSDDSDENPFDIDLRGTGFEPTMEIEQPAGTLLTDESSSVDFGSADPGSPVSLEFTLRNISAAPLTGIAVSTSGSHPGDFIPGPVSPTTLAPGNTMTFTVSFNPSAPGDRSAVVHVTSNESTANPFDFDVTGIGGSFAPLGDADNDATVNMVEEATASDPLVPGPPPGVLVKNGDFLEYHFNRSVAAVAEMTIVAEYSDNLVDWIVMPESAALLLADDGVVQSVVYSLNAGPNGERYLRIRVSRP
jgi:hypothetical protein